MTVGVLLPLAFIVVTLGWMIGSLIYFRVRDRRAEPADPEALKR
ncbi:MAG: hypothetical protein OXJ62_05495 [Spirochaetaceae bacterium]|nr:hypothetical protein [Spirochaetaceae bacterium]